MLPREPRGPGPVDSRPRDVYSRDRLRLDPAMDSPRESPAVVPPVGASVPRVDGVAKVTGRARYLDDLDAPDAWFGATVRSAVPHGVLDGFDRDPAFQDWSRIVLVTAANIPGRNVIALIEDD